MKNIVMRTKNLLGLFKIRDPYAKELLDRQGPYKQRVEKDKIKFTRKVKHKKMQEF